MSKENPNIVERWLLSGHWSAEGFKIILWSSVWLMIFTTPIETYLHILKTPLRVLDHMEANRERMARDSRNDRIIEAAHSEWLDVQIQVCEGTTDTRGELLKCLSRVKKRDAR